MTRPLKSPLIDMEPLGQKKPERLQSIPDPIGFLEEAHREQLRICDMLEEIADSLPLQIDRLKCFCAAGKLRTSVVIHQLDEDLGLFPTLRRRSNLDPGVRSSLERLEAEHIDDEGFAAEVVDALEDLARGRAVSSVETLAYMLRGFFEGHRRHIAFENEIILPLARKILVESDLLEIEHVMLENRQKGPADFFSPLPCANAKAAFLDRADRERADRDRADRRIKTDPGATPKL